MKQSEARRALRHHRAMTWKDLNNIEEVWVVSLHGNDPLLYVGLHNLDFVCDLLLSFDIPLDSSIQRLEEVIQDQEFEILPISDIRELCVKALSEIDRVIKEYRPKLRKTQHG
ncbi:MAG: hypothetical protein E6Q97_39480 [Desulfurellales bacterium]|nr:MAG: hypothetical protein E6Q97_39480 [Desulfurellales bacterium]